MHGTLWSGRDVALFIYCPRLFHRVVMGGYRPPPALLDRIGWMPVRPSLDGLMSIGEVRLTHQGLGLIDSIELAELTASRAVPLLLRSGPPRYAPLATGRPREAEPHPHDAFLLALHALVLEEVGYEASHGLIYYAAEDCTLRLPLDGLLRIQSLELLERARACAAGPYPDHQCDGCADLPE